MCTKGKHGRGVNKHRDQLNGTIQRAIEKNRKWYKAGQRWEEGVILSVREFAAIHSSRRGLALG